MRDGEDWGTSGWTDGLFEPYGPPQDDEVSNYHHGPSQDLFTCRPEASPGNWQDHHHLSELNVERI